MGKDSVFLPHLGQLSPAEIKKVPLQRVFPRRNGIYVSLRGLGSVAAAAVAAAVALAAAAVAVAAMVVAATAAAE